MTSRFKYRVFTGPVGVGEIAARLVAADIQATAGTEHVYGEMSADDENAAEALLNAAAGYALFSRRAGDSIARLLEDVDRLAQLSVRGDPRVSAFVIGSMSGDKSMLVTEGTYPVASSWSGSEEAWVTAQREARERLGIPEPAPAPAKAPKRKRVKA